MTTATHKTETAEFVAVLAAAAAVVAQQLNGAGYTTAHAEVIFEPGDATSYTVMVARPRRVTVVSKDAVTHIGNRSQHYTVTLVNPDFGRTYPWLGCSMSWDYVADKWTMKYNGKADEHTGRVLCGFLNELAKLVPTVETR